MFHYTFCFTFSAFNFFSSAADLTAGWILEENYNINIFHCLDDILTLDSTNPWTYKHNLDYNTVFTW